MARTSISVILKFMVIPFLIIHVSLLCLSLVVTMGSAFGVIVGYSIPQIVIRLNSAGTLVGLLAGAGLLLQKPLSVKCVALLAYLIVFTAAQIFITKRNHNLASSADL
jgi:hypothetical protein